MEYEKVNSFEIVRAKRYPNEYHFTEKSGISR